MAALRSILILVAAMAALGTLLTPTAQAQQLRLVEQGAQAERPQLPDADGMMILIRTTLIALDQANRTGNYSVLRDLGAPGFREGNTPARLAELFADLRARELHLGPLSVVDASLTRQPSIDENGMLRLTGYFHTRPEEVNFDLLFQYVQGQWQLFGLGVGTDVPDDAAAATPPAQAEAPPPQAEPAEPQQTAEQPELEESIPLAGSDTVAQAQAALEALGYQPGPVDGLVGPQTVEAVREFQRDAGLDETGEITPELVEVLEDAAG